MRIDQTGSPMAPLSARRLRRSGADGFALPAGEASEAGGVDLGNAASGGVGCLLPAAAVGPSGPAGGAAQADETAAGQGRALLGALAGLQLAALGDGGVQARRTLADLARALPQAADPRLDEVLRAIAQRAAIELARGG